VKVIPLVLAILLAPLLIGVINRTKAIFGGRTGQPLLQPYFDLWKLLHKGAVYSRTTSWLFRAGPIVSLATVLVAAALMPLGGCPSLIAFSGDLVLFAYLLALGRFFTVTAALDTGSAFEGMGASREVFFSTLAEPALLLGLAAIAKQAIDTPLTSTPLISLSEIHSNIAELWSHSGLIPVFVGVALVIVYLAENSRIPVDDPNTHLELTMIHEVMVLDHSGPDFAFILYGAALKLWVLGALIVGMVLPGTGIFLVDLLVSVVGMFVLAVVVGVIESVMGRLRMVRVSQLLVVATTLSALALVLEYR
jgi:formate hydrogenlyase subunit 4